MCIRDRFKATAQSEILFKFDSYELNEEAQKMLSNLCNIITEIPKDVYKRQLVTTGKLRQIPRTENNPHGLIIKNGKNSYLF